MADVEASPSDVAKLESMLRCAAEGLDAELDNLLFKEHGADLLSVCRDEAGRTPLHLAAANGHQACVESLLLAGHAWNAVDDSYVSAGELARAHGHDMIYEILLQAGIRTELLLTLLEGQDEGDEEETSEISAMASSAPSDAISSATVSHEPASSSNGQITNGNLLSSATSNAAYLKSKLSYSDDNTRLLDEEKNAVMMDWEAPLMKEHARWLCEREGRNAKDLEILNVGFGLGLIDTAIQSYHPKRHTIIEAHPDVYAKMIQDGWAEKEGVTILFGRWQDFLANGQLETYDGIFWDTFAEHYRDQKVFHDAIPMLLKPGGVFSFFNGLGGTNPFFHDVYCKIVELEFEEMGYSVTYIPMEMNPEQSQIWDGVKRRYWSLTSYNLPIITSLDGYMVGYDDVDDGDDDGSGPLDGN